MSSGVTLSRTDFFPGFLLSLEPKYRASDRLAIGIQLQSSTVSQLVDGDVIESFDIGTVYGTIDYYLKGTRKVQTFLGAGAGLAQHEYFDSVYGYGLKNDQAFVLKGGLDYRHLTCSLEYNIIEHLNFFSIKFGVSIGGGKRK